VEWVQAGQCIAGLRVHEAPGHTPGNVVLEVEGQNLWFLGDLFHHPAQIVHPEWPSASFDVNSALNTRTRQRYIKHFADMDAILFAQHLGNQFKICKTAPGQFSVRYGEF
jgi:glyoxylase-like metal-dependent hydrolase (beta-lactamase superfamily II)